MTIIGGLVLYKNYRFLKDNLDKEHLLTTNKHLEKVYLEQTKLVQDLEKYKELYEETRTYTVKATIKLEQRPEQIRKELLNTIKEQQAQLNFITVKLKKLQQATERENNFLFKRISNIEDNMVRKNKSDIRY